jgi:hypothetical protein
MRKLNLKLAILLIALLFAQCSIAQTTPWILGGNPLTSNGTFGSTTDYDILFTRNNVQSGLLNAAANNTSWGVASLNNVVPGVSPIGMFNTAIGIYSLQKNITGFANTAVGSQTLQLNTSGVYNTAVGWNALTYDTSGSNTGIGASALEYNISGGRNTAVGGGSICYNQSGMYNASVGYQTMYFANNSNASYNATLGAASLFNSQTAGYNVAVGYSALYNDSTGNYNTAVGDQTLLSNTRGTYNIALGYRADVASYNLTNATAIGANAVVGQSNSIVLGSVTSGFKTNIGIGTTTPNNKLEIVSDATGTSGLRLTNLTTVTSSPPTTDILSLDASNNVILVPSGSLPTGPANGNFWGLTGNTGTNTATNFIGTVDYVPLVFKVDNIMAGLLDNVEDNTVFGTLSYNTTSTGTGNVAIGSRNLSANTIGIFNTSMGTRSLQANTMGKQNTSIGANAMLTNISGNYNTGIGDAALYFNNTGSFNTAVGLSALGNNSSGDYNVAIGYSALDISNTGSYNTAIGQGANISIDGIYNSTAVGANAVATTSNQVMLGDASVIGVATYGPVYLTSDGRYKKNIQENVPGLDFIKQLRPVTYNYDVKGLKEKTKPQSATNVTNTATVPTNQSNIQDVAVAAKEKKIYTGFVAQEVEAAANKSHYDFSGIHKPENDHDTYGLSYSDFVPSLVKSVQELATQNDSLKSALAQQQDVNNNTQQQLNDLKTTISQMQTAMSQCCNNYSTSMATAAKPALITGVDAATLQQNVPNPYNESTVIAYHLPQSTTNAQIIVSDLSGNVLKSIALNGNGNGQITFNAGSFASGSYFYTLLVNGQKVDTKEMIVAN